MKFAHVALTADLYHPTLPVDVGGHLEIDPRHGQRLCVKKHAGMCVVKDGSVIFCRTFGDASKLFKNASSWAALGKNIFVLFSGDHANQPGEDVASQVAEKGLRMFQHNMDFSIFSNTLHPVDGLMFPMGMSPAADHEATDAFLTKYRRGPPKRRGFSSAAGSISKEKARRSGSTIRAKIQTKVIF